MNDRRLIKIIICCLVINLSWCVPMAHSDEIGQSNGQSQLLLGKSDPFKAIKIEVETPKAIVKEPVLIELAPAPQPQVAPIVIPETEPEPPELFIKTVMLKFLRAENVQPAAVRMLSAYGSVSTDEDTNSLIICDSRENLYKIITEIREADQTPKQIMIEVFILDVTISDDTEIGVNWSDLSLGDGDSYTQALSTLTSGGSLNIIRSDISVAVQALQKVRNVEILASPRILVVSGQEARIRTVEEIPYEELSQSAGGVGSADPITSTQFKTAGITLTVQPTITDDGRILMHITPDQSVDTGVPGLDGRVPIINRREAETTLLLRDGQVVAIGGLRRKDTKLLQDKIPLLGDIPIIGFLFSSDKVVVIESELLVLISPHIYDDGPAPTDDEIIKYNSLKDRPLLNIPRHDTLKPQIIQERPEFKMMRNLLSGPNK